MQVIWFNLIKSEKKYQVVQCRCSYAGVGGLQSLPEWLRKRDSNTGLSSFFFTEEQITEI